LQKIIVASVEERDVYWQLPTDKAKPLNRFRGINYTIRFFPKGMVQWEGTVRGL
jgi:hypothetical protein